jgi:hypothetical protein
MASTRFTKEKHFWIIVINSLSYFMLAYITVITLTNFVSILLAKTENVKGILYYYGFNLFDIQQGWSKELTFLVFFFGIGFSAVIALLFEWVYKRLRKYSIHNKLFFLWGFFLGMVYFLGNVLVGAFFYFGTGVVFTDFNIPVLFRILTGIGALILLIYLGVFVTRSFLISLNCYVSDVNKQEYQWYMKAQLLYPFILGTVLILILKIPHHNEFFLLDTLIWLTGIVPVIAVFLKLSGQQSFHFRNKNVKIEVFYGPLTAFIILVLIYRIGLTNGIVF